MAKNIYGQELPNQTYTGTYQLAGEPSPSNYTFNPGTRSYTVNGVQQYGQTPGGTSGRTSKTPDYLGGYNQMSGVKPGQAEGGAVQGFFANPSGKQGGFQSLTSSLLDNPEVYKNVRDRAIQFGNDPVWLEQLGKASDTARKGFEGSTSSIDPAILGKMWK
jgi:hypothetical protein